MLTTELQPVTVTEGESIKLVCKVSVEPRPTVKWLKDGKPIDFDDRMFDDYDGQYSTLEIDRTIMSDKGIYVCDVRNEFGTAQSRTELIVKKKTIRPELVGQIMDNDAFEGEQASFNVEFTGDPKPIVEWFRGSDKIEHGGRYNITSKDKTYTLTISGLTRKDTGTYTCIATNEAGKTTLRSYLGVKEKKKEFKFDVEERNKISCVKGQETTLSITIDGNPEIIWYKDGKRIFESSTIFFKKRNDTYSLVIKGASYEDSGTYTCEAKTSAGPVFQSFLINVKGNYDFKNIRIRTALITVQYKCLK